MASSSLTMRQTESKQRGGTCSSPHCLPETAVVFPLMVAPVHSVHVEGHVGGVMHIGAVGHHQAEARRAELHTEVIVLETAYRVLLVESFERPEGIGAHGQAESDQSGQLSGAAAVGPAALLGELADGQSIVAAVRDVLHQLSPRDPVRLGSDRAHLGVGQRGQQLVQPASVDDGVVVQKNNAVAAGHRGTLIAAPGETLVFVIGDHFDPGVVGELLFGGIGRPVVDHHYLVPRPQCRSQRVQAGPGVLPGVPGQKDDGRPATGAFGTHGLCNGPFPLRIDHRKP